MVGVVLVDFKKAFDLVDHEILKNKLEIYGIKDEALLWFNTYLTNRKQQVTIDNKNQIFNLFHVVFLRGLFLDRFYSYFL